MLQGREKMEPGSSWKWHDEKTMDTALNINHILGKPRRSGLYSTDYKQQSLKRTRDKILLEPNKNSNKIKTFEMLIFPISVQ